MISKANVVTVNIPYMEHMGYGNGKSPMYRYLLPPQFKGYFPRADCPLVIQHSYETSPLLMGKLTINCHVQ